MTVRPETGARPGADAGGLYPFLAAADPAGAGAAQAGRVMAEVVASSRQKAAEIVALRRELVELHAAGLARAACAMARCFAAGGRLYAFGNGGSSSDAQQLVTSLVRPRLGRPLPARSLTSDSAVVTALSNDVGYEVVFARQLAAAGRRGDIAVGLSTSGGSTNVVRAFEQAARLGLVTVAVTGDRGGRLAELDVIDHLFVVPSASVHRVQEAQTTLYHALGELTQRALEALEADRGS
jgi:D-sedoheptulose 7-phosphate isomerase